MVMVVTRNIIISIIIIIMIVVTRNIDITFCRVFHTPPDFPDKIFTLVVILGPLTMAAWDILHLICSWIKPHPFLRVAGDRGPDLALVYFLGLITAGSHLTAVFLAECNHSIFVLLILKYVAGSADLVVVPLAVIFGYKEVRTGVLGVYR